MDAEKVLILGIGNVLWADEGFGVRVVQALEQEFDFPDSVSLLDGGTQGLGLIPYVQASNILIIVDAVDFQLTPGAFIQLNDDEVPAYLGAKKMSLHQISFQEVLAICQLMGNCPRRLCLIGVQPEVLEDYGGSLSPVVKARMQDAMDAVVSLLESHGIFAIRKSTSSKKLNGAVDIEEYERLRPSPEAAYRLGDSRFLGLGT